MPLPLDTGYVASPLNYTGGKLRLLPQILPLFPHDIHTFVDLFCGGCNVGLNVASERLVLNDSNGALIGMLNCFRRLGAAAVVAGVDDIIDRYGLSRSDRYGYARYGCDSSRGLAAVNRSGFMRLRADLNAMRIRPDTDYYLRLYVSVVYAFNNQLRFNSAGDFNLPVGKRDFNSHMRRKLTTFIESLQQPGVELSWAGFDGIDLRDLGPGDFVYADPPYLLSCASYNESGGWTEDNERRLYNVLDYLNANGVRFALSNVVVHKGHAHSLLREWLAARSGFTCHNLVFGYSNSNYHISNRTSPTAEVLITNY